MNITPRTLSALTCAGVITFIVVVIALHLAQPGYDPLSQFMSELALGRFGGFLVIAFSGLAASIAATAANLRAHQSPALPPLVLLFAAVSFLAAGIITLAMSTQVHVALVAGAFVACGMGMYLLPRIVPAFSDPVGRVASWGAGLVMCAATGLSDNVILPAIAQRISALALLFWLSFAAWRLAR